MPIKDKSTYARKGHQGQTFPPSPGGIKMVPYNKKKHHLAQAHKLGALANHLKKITNFTVEEIKVMLLIHQKIEEIGGPIDRTIFREICCIVFHITDDVMLDLIFRAFDNDSDGYVDDIEWIRGMSILLRGTLDQLIDYTYSVYDMNNDGSLAREELHHCLKGCLYAGFGLDEDELEDCERDIVEIAMRKLDTDRDGQITYSDFARAVKKDALLLQACGPCLPGSRASSAFQSLVTERYQQQSALYPKMPATRAGFYKTAAQKRKSMMMTAKSLDTSSSFNIGGGGRGGSGLEFSLGSDTIIRPSQQNHSSHNDIARMMSLSVVRSIPILD